MLAEVKNTEAFNFRVVLNNAKQLPPAAAKLILYGARDMTKRKFYVDGIHRYTAYLKKCFFIEKALFKFTTAKTYTRPTYLVATSRRTLKALELERQMNICFVSITLLNLPLLIKKRISFISLSPVKAYLDEVFLKQMDAVCPSLQDVFKVEAYLAKNNFTCFVYDTPTTINNLLAYYFRKQGKKVIYLQHGIYQLKNYKLDVTTKTFATGFVVWGEAFKKLFIDNGIHRSNIRIGCINKPVKQRSVSNHKNEVCFFGLPLTKFNEPVCAEILEIISKTNKACKELGYRLVYKPHPMENAEDTAARFRVNNIQVPVLSVKRSVQRSLDAFNVFVGLYSTTLIEASMQNKKVLQITMQTKDYDDFSKLGICKTVSSTVSDFTEILRDIIEQRSQSLKADSYYIRHTDNPGIRYKQCIESLITETPTIISNEEMYA